MSTASPYFLRRRAYETVDRTVKLAATYTRKAADALHWTDAPSPPVVGYWTLLETMLRAAVDIAGELPDAFYETTTERSFLDGQPMKLNLSDEADERARELVALIERRRGETGVRKQIAALENVDGREPEEAELYRAKARELRASKGVT